MRTFAAIADRLPPSEIQLWNVGDNPTDYGVHKWTEKSVELVFGAYEQRGNPLLIDVEHNVGKPSSEKPVELGGYARLEVRAGAPWLVFDWSAYAVEQIATGQRRFLSPEYDVSSDGEIVGLTRVSLVAEPGTHRARVLASAHKEPHMDLEMILAALRAALAAEDPAVVKESIANLVGELAPSAPSSESASSDAPAAPPSGAEVEAAAPSEPEKDSPVAAAAPAADDKPVAASKLALVASNAVRIVENSTRDHILATQGHRLEPSILRWAKTQPLAVVKGLIDAAPAAKEPAARVAATRGDTQGAAVEPQGLQGQELEDLQRQLGTYAGQSNATHRTEGSRLVLSSMTPSQARQHQAAMAAKKVGA